MRIRFLQTTASQNPNFPFQAGQVIALDRLTPEARQWIKDGRAEVVLDSPEAAVQPAGERAVQPKAHRRTADVRV